MTRKIKMKESSWLMEDLTKEQIECEKALAFISGELELKRLELKMSQKEFAKILGVTQGMVSKWESGIYNFTIETLISILVRLQLKPIEFLDKFIQTTTVKVKENSSWQAYGFKRIPIQSKQLVIAQ